MNFRDSYCNIQGWMIEDLNLGGNELIVYAVIYGFCRDGRNWYQLSQDYVAKWCGITTRGLRKILKSLEERELIRVNYHGKGECSEYMTLKPEAEQSSGEYRNSVPVVEEQSSASGGTQFRQYRNSVPPVEELSSSNTYNNINNNINNINNNIIGDAPEKKRKKFVKPSIDEIIEYCRERQNHVDPQKFYDHYESNGWMVGKNAMKDWKAAVRTWERNGYSGSNTNAPRVYADNKPEGFDYFDF